MDAIIQAGKKAKTKAADLKSRKAVLPQKVITELERHILVDGFKLVFDVAKSHGSVFYDAATGQGLLNYFLRALNCRAISEQGAIEMSGLTPDELRSRSFVRILQRRTSG